MTRNTPYKRKVRKLDFSNDETQSSGEESTKHSKKKYKDSTESSNSNREKKKNAGPYDEISGEFINIKPPMSNG